MKGNKEINVVDQTSATDGSNESYVEVIIMSNSHRCMKAHMLLMLILSIQLSTIIINKQLLIIGSMLMID